MNLTVLMEAEIQFEADTCNGNIEIYIECRKDNPSSETHSIASCVNECVRSFIR